MAYQTNLEDYTKRFDYDNDGNILYKGSAKAGTTTSSAFWSISKYYYANGNLLSVLWADGNTLEDNIWDNRTSLTYI